MNLQQKKAMSYNVIALRDVVIFPGIVTPLFIGRKKSVKAIEAAAEDNMQIVLISQKSAGIDEPGADDVYPIGTLADIVQIMKLPDGTLKLLVEGICRVTIDTFLNAQLTTCEATQLADISHDREDETNAVRLMLLDAFERYLKALQRQPKELLKSVGAIQDLSLITDIIASHIQVSVEKKIPILLENNVKERISQTLILLEGEVGVIDLEKTIRQRVKAQMDKNQKEYYLNEQAKAIQKELEDLDDSKTDFGSIEKDIKASKIPKAIEKKCLKELDKLRRMPAMSSEAVVLRNYLEHMIAFPWSKSSKGKHTLSQAQEILESSHYGLTDVKKRIIEYIAVQQRKKKPSGNILCLVGPPGVGKTSIGKSIAKALNRKYIRMALGGIRDEAEIRGHRRTYIGAMPGKIVQNITKSKTNNPLFLLDEIDKIGMDYRGDPASAMLEVLDPEQNHSFGDNYMETDIDLSNVMFIATANSLDIPDALRDRMEIIRIPGYTESEKLAIAKRYLLAKNIEHNRLSNEEIAITDGALQKIIENYTREAGVRQLDREIAKICRKVVTAISLKKNTEVAICKNNLSDYLGVEKYHHDSIVGQQSIGSINGLAWTAVGGELLNIETAILPGKGKITLTGKLGDVMKESVDAAMTVVKSYANHLGTEPSFFQEHDFHIHLPEAATPKDGPSAGTAIATALLSAVMDLPIDNTIAMTGEITLRGNVLEIGGLKEKLFAAAREGIKTVFIPKANEKDLADIAQEVLDSLHTIPVTHIDAILEKIFPNGLNMMDKSTNPIIFSDKYRQSHNRFRPPH